MNPTTAIEAAESTFAALAPEPAIASDAQAVKGRSCPECGGATHLNSWWEEGMYFAEVICDQYPYQCSWWEEL